MNRQRFNWFDPFGWYANLEKETMAALDDAAKRAALKWLSMGQQMLAQASQLH